MGRSSNNKVNKKKISKSGGAHNGGWGRNLKTKHRTRDLDQIQEDIAKYDPSKPRPFNQDLPGCGQYYCLACARYFINETTMEEHLRSKLHKKRVKLANEKPYSQAEANAAAGMGAAKHD